jgi:hypothetical protein
MCLYLLGKDRKDRGTYDFAEQERCPISYPGLGGIRDSRIKNIIHTAIDPFSSLKFLKDEFSCPTFIVVFDSP